MRVFSFSFFPFFVDWFQSFHFIITVKRVFNDSIIIFFVCVCMLSFCPVKGQNVVCFFFQFWKEASLEYSCAFINKRFKLASNVGSSEMTIQCYYVQSSYMSSENEMIVIWLPFLQATFFTNTMRKTFSDVVLGSSKINRIQKSQALYGQTALAICSSLCGDPHPKGRIFSVRTWYSCRFVLFLVLNQSTIHFHPSRIKCIPNKTNRFKKIGTLCR